MGSLELTPGQVSIKGAAKASQLRAHWGCITENTWPWWVWALLDGASSQASFVCAALHFFFSTTAVAAATTNEINNTILGSSAISNFCPFGPTGETASL